MNQKLLFLLLFVLSFADKTEAQTRETVKKSTDILMFATPVAGLAATFVLNDPEGTKQLFFAGATSITVSYILKYSIDKQRPDATDSHSFPSNHTAMAFQGASFIQRRYGWKYGLPAYLLSGYVAWGRVYSKRHDCWDVLAGAAIGTGSTYLFTSPFAKKHNLAVSPCFWGDDYLGGYLSIKF